MRIDNSFLTGLNSASPKKAPVAQDAGLRLVAPSASSAEGSAHVPSPEVATFQQGLSQIPEVRQDRLDDVSAKLASGYYLTPQAASWTAGAILGSVE